MISVGRLPVTTSIQVNNIDDSNLDTLRAYLQNNRRSGGGPIHRIFDVNQEERYALVEFQESAGVYL